MKDLIQYLTTIEKLVSQSKINNALKMLVDLMGGSEHKYNILLQTSRYNGLIEAKRLGQINFSEFNLESNKIKLAIIETIKVLREEATSNENLPSNPLRNENADNSKNSISTGNVDKGIISGEIKTDGGDFKVSF